MRKSLRSRYPHNWELISAQVKFDRAKNRCEICQLPNNLYIRRLKFGGILYLNCKQIDYEISLAKHNGMTEKQHLKLMHITKVSLSVAHLDHNEINNDFDNLKCLCQSCLLKHNRLNNRLKSKLKK